MRHHWPPPNLRHVSSARITFHASTKQHKHVRLERLVSQPHLGGAEMAQQLRDDAQVQITTSNFKDAKGGSVTPASFTYAVSDTSVLGLSDVSADGLTATLVAVGAGGTTAQLQRSGTNPDGTTFQLSPVDVQLISGEIASADTTFGDPQTQTQS